jgi:chromosome segregation ATPase
VCATDPESALVEERTKLLQTILRLATELNETDRRFAEMTRLYEGAERDVDALREEVATLREGLHAALALYADAEADVTRLREMTERLTQELESRDATLATYRAEGSAKAWLAFFAGLLGGVAGKLLLEQLGK